VFKQHGQDLKGLIMKLDLDAVFVQLARAQVNFENTKADPSGWNGHCHGCLRYSGV
jgi:hypothetical protein